jgi:hypothetical protein
MMHVKYTVCLELAREKSLVYSIFILIYQVQHLPKRYSCILTIVIYALGCTVLRVVYLLMVRVVVVVSSLACGS